MAARRWPDVFAPPVRCASIMLVLGTKGGAVMSYRGARFVPQKCVKYAFLMYYDKKIVANELNRICYRLPNGSRWAVVTPYSASSSDGAAAV